MKRQKFREQVCERDGGECVVWHCDREVTPNPSGPGEQHHLVERAEWPNGGYIRENGASVCNLHHRYAEQNAIPPQAFWSWIGLTPVTPNDMGVNVDKWGEPFETLETPALTSGKQLPFSPAWTGNEDHESIDDFVDLPLVAFPVGDAPLRTQTIDEPVDNIAATPPFRIYVQDGTVLGVYNPTYRIWLSWDETVVVAESANLSTPELIVETYDDAEPPYTAEYELYNDLREALSKTQRAIVRSRLPMHEGQVSRFVGEYRKSSD